MNYENLSNAFNAKEKRQQVVNKKKESQTVLKWYPTLRLVNLGKFPL